MMSDTEVVERQNAIIRLQSGIIDDLFRQLMQYVSVEEAGSLSVVNRINLAAQLRAEIKRG